MLRTRGAGRVTTVVSNSGTKGGRPRNRQIDGAVVRATLELLEEVGDAADLRADLQRYVQQRSESSHRVAMRVGAGVRESFGALLAGQPPGVIADVPYPALTCPEA